MNRQSYAEMVYIGHDGREPIATEVCELSMRAGTASPLMVQRLVEPALRHSGIYRREWKMQGNQKVDMRDRMPFSTDFSFTRFLVPTLMQHRGWALFCDADFLWLGDVADLFAMADSEKAVQVVKHKPLEGFGTKMDGQAQQPYFRKNWSSLVLWNCEHPSNQRLTPYHVNGMSGQWLHSFGWLESEEIGELPGEWNWLARIDPQPKNGDPKAVHFTLGIPDMVGYEGSPYADHWRRVKARL
jgi:hypothetical protein